MAASIGYGLSIVTAPTEEPLTLGECRQACAIGPDVTDHDAILLRSLKSARLYFEEQTGRAVCTQTWDYFADQFPANYDPIRLPKAPLSSVTTLKYYDNDGTLQTWSSSNYIVSTSREPGRISLAYNQTWPTTRIQADAVQIRFVAGWGNAGQVPALAKTGLLALVVHWFENRQAIDMDAGRGEHTVPLSAQAIIDHYRLGDDFIYYGPSPSEVE